MTALRVLICEDEYLLASDLAAELDRRGLTVAAIMARASEVADALERDDLDIDLAVLDVQLLDGTVYHVVEPLLARGVAVIFCTGYGRRDLPAEFAHFPCVGKPTDVDLLLEAFRQFQNGLQPLEVG
jgi:ActR/RegA family two-component response regulator